MQAQSLPCQLSLGTCVQASKLKPWPSVPQPRLTCCCSVVATSSPSPGPGLCLPAGPSSSQAVTSGDTQGGHACSPRSPPLCSAAANRSERQNRCQPSPSLSGVQWIQEEGASAQGDPPAQLGFPQALRRVLARLVRTSNVNHSQPPDLEQDPSPRPPEAPGSLLKRSPSGSARPVHQPAANWAGEAAPGTSHSSCLGFFSSQ